VPTWTLAAGALIFALSAEAAIAATAENAQAEPAKTQSAKADKAKADENRKKPLQRCDQLADKAQQDCLEKARQRIVEARQKREGSGKGGDVRGQAAGKGSAAKDTPSK
jgi:pyruvate/2-oxoglutarate dehydrogenase complex dihydrolipoamide acyltransferase (E2) component